MRASSTTVPLTLRSRLNMLFIRRFAVVCLSWSKTSYPESALLLPPQRLNDEPTPTKTAIAPEISNLVVNAGANPINKARRYLRDTRMRVCQALELLIPTGQHFDVELRGAFVPFDQSCAQLFHRTAPDGRHRKILRWNHQHSFSRYDHLSLSYRESLETCLRHRLTFVRAV